MIAYQARVIGDRLLTFAQTPVLGKSDHTSPQLLARGASAVAGAAVVFRTKISDLEGSAATRWSLPWLSVLNSTFV